MNFVQIVYVLSLLDALGLDVELVADALPDSTESQLLERANFLFLLDHPGLDAVLYTRNQAVEYIFSSF